MVKKGFLTNYVLGLVFIVFLALFIYKSFISMINTPFYDFDEAHRAENAKRMREYKSFFVPLTGSSFDRIETFKIPLKDNPHFYLYYHIERPALTYNLMILSTYFFGETEFVYRLPSFIFGLLTIIVLIIFAKKILYEKDSFVVALFVSLLAIITSVDLWLSSQYAQLDTSLTFFLFLSVLSLIVYCKQKTKFYIYFAGFSFALAVLSKGQPAIIILFPLAFLKLSKRLNLKDLISFFIAASVILLPWFLLLSFKFGPINVIKIFSSFAISSAAVEYLHHKAPVFWYLRWWWESLRPGWTIFLALFVFDIIKSQLTWQKKTLASFIFGSLIAFSLPQNKIWWYILPLIPAMTAYIYLSISTYLKQNCQRLLNLSLVIIIASLPIMLRVSNKLTIAYGAIITALVIAILLISLPKLKPIFINLIFAFAVFSSLFIFSSNFPKITLFDWNTKEVALFYSKLSGKNCLWVKDMPTEAALFYSNAGQVRILNHNSNLYFISCDNYLITPASMEDLKNDKILPLTEIEQIYSGDSIKLYKIK